MKKRLLALSAIVLVLWACAKVVPSAIEEDEGLKVLYQSAESAKEQIANTLKNTAIKLADGLEITLWATDSLAPDPVAMSIDPFGAVYITRAVRPNSSEFDIRGHRDWMTESIKMQSIEDRRAFLHRIFSDENSEENQWLPDLNGDGLHNWKDLAVEKDEVWKIEDTDGDGIADKSSRVLKDFNEEIADVANGVLIREDDMFVSIGPDLWRLEDTDGDGYYDKKTSLVRGFNVHIGFGGHGVSGIIEGPDGKIYVGAGDIGANLTDLSGKNHFYPNEGVIVRCNPDGSDFEVFSRGHRNTHEFVFDYHGNLISADNDGDHPGESERLVHIVEGSDSGWRINWQFGKYTDPLNNDYKVWMDERLFVPRWKGQASHIIPPLQNFHNGPTGMAFNPGAGLGKKWQNRFFLVEFVGNPTRSHIWSFTLRPKGASFELKEEIDMMSGLLPTGLRFAPDGSLFFSDWVNGWNTKNYGRVWRIDVTKAENDLADLRKKTAEWIATDFESLDVPTLKDLLSYEDYRVRQKAQFELVKRPEGAEVFQEVARSGGWQLARIHAVWGLGQLLYKNDAVGSPLIALLRDTDLEIAAQAAKVLGDARHQVAEKELLSALERSYPRLQFYAAQALGRLGSKAAVEPLFSLLRKNNDADVYMRHVASFALSRIGDTDALAARASSKYPAERLGALLALRRLKHPSAALFLKDKEEQIVTDAARAINDDESIPEALPALAAILENPAFINEALIRRAINANLRVGTEEAMQRLIRFTDKEGLDPELKAETLATLSTWASPSVLDRVDGRYRGEFSRDKSALVAGVSPLIKKYLNSSDESLQQAAVLLVQRLEIKEELGTVFLLAAKASSSDLKNAILETLVLLQDSRSGDLVQRFMQDKDRGVRAQSLKYLDKISLTPSSFQSIASNLMNGGSTAEKQQLISVISKLPLSTTQPVVEKLIEDFAAKKLDPNVALELEETIQATNNSTLIDAFAKAKPQGSEADTFAEALYGGNGWNGRSIFRNNATAQCSRCHVVNGEGGQVGPDLSKIGNDLSREQLLEALVDPSARIAPGYGFVSVVLKDGQEAAGILLKETEDELELKTDEAAEPLRIAKSRIGSRTNVPSSMPPMGSILSKREIRDLVAYLATLK